MSVASELIRKAIFAKSNVPTLVGDGLLTGIYNGKAPTNSNLPYGVFTRYVPGRTDHTFRQTLALESDLWLFKVLADLDSVATLDKEPQEFAADMLALWIQTLGGELVIAGHNVGWLVVEQDMPDYEETSNDRYIYHRGSMLRIKTEPA